jgi:hypothetical protein
VLTTGVGGCSKLAIAGFWSKFNADRDPLDEGAEPLPAEATERTPAVPANGEEAVGATAAEPVEITPGRGAAIDFVMGAVAVGGVLLAVSAVVCATWPDATPDVSAVESAWDVVGGAVVEVMAGRLANDR